MSRYRVSMDSFDEILRNVVAEHVNYISYEAKKTQLLAANELRNASLIVLSGQRSGRFYRIPGTKQIYQASAPGEAPANRTGTLRTSWQPESYAQAQGNEVRLRSVISSNVPYAEYLEKGTKNPNGTVRMAARPYCDRIREQAKPKVQQIYRRRYFH